MIVKTKNSKDHLCKICSLLREDCLPEGVKFGNGFAGANVIECRTCVPRTGLNPLPFAIEINFEEDLNIFEEEVF